MIKIHQLSAGHDSDNVFSNLNLTLREGEIVSLLGANGCGKTTLLRTALGLHPKRSGSVKVNNQDFHRMDARQRARLISYVPQYHRLAFGYPVIEMVLMGTQAGKSGWSRPNAADRENAENALELMNIDHLRNRPYTQLSGGQRQLVLIARALAQNTPMIFMDEPTNGLDFGNQIKLLEKIRSLKSQGKSVLFTTHHPEQALSTATRAISMRNGQIAKDGRPRDVLQVEHLRELYQLDERQLPDGYWPTSFIKTNTARQDVA
ncbi:ABC transporter ATP-binding protein [Thiomicrorhabdus sp.]|uniref:ABC transporter ATP-binding protein n=1 Tax=Thiomicrorhabdus sp. TaxID=2039724 RepID=UPI0029C7529E|nr:ABC transporter ATP-binding protein [Thiomicrorhabdus sp.]